MLKNSALYGIEIVSADGSAPSVFLTFTGAEIKKLVKLAQTYADSVTTVENSKEDA